MNAMQTRLDRFDPRNGLIRGRPKSVEAIWYLVKCGFFLTPLPWPSGLKVKLLRLFGAKVGHGVVIKPRVNIHFPWKLEIGHHTWIGEEVFILNFEPVTIGSHVCISQRAFLCAGNHDARDPAFSYRNAPISIADGVWIGACSFIAPNTRVGPEALICAGSIVTSSVEANAVYAGNPAAQISVRWKG
jgi:putative colanic acid biosynthesis acetyltransferase WcaF